MNGRERAAENLAAIENKYIAFFNEKQLTIMDCVKLKGKTLVSAHVTSNALPPEIADEIEHLFWVV